MRRCCFPHSEFDVGRKDVEKSPDVRHDRQEVPRRRAAARRDPLQPRPRALRHAHARLRPRHQGQREVRRRGPDLRHLSLRVSIILMK